MRFAGLLLAGLAMALPAPVRAQGSPPAIVFRDVSVLTMEADTALPGRSVIVRGSAIAWVGPTADLRVPPGATVIEGRGRFLLPGLADMHVHMELDDGPLFLANGITTVRQMNGSPAHLALRDSIAQGLRLGPRMSVTSPLLAGTPQRWRHVLVPDSATAVRVAEEAAEAGYDALKVYDGLSKSSYAALVEAGRRLGLPLVGHIPADVGLDGVLAAGQRSIEHVEQITYATVNHRPDPARIPEIAARIARSGAWVTPTLAAMRNLSIARTPAYRERLEAPETRFVDPDIRGWWASLAPPKGAPPPAPDDPHRLRAEAFYAFERDLTRALWDAGVPLLVGTDTPNPLLVPGYSLHDEIDALVAAGIPPVAVLEAATAGAARFLGEEGKWGVVATGAAADLVLVEENPLERIATLRSPDGVMVRGTWLDREALDGMLEGRARRSP